MDTEALIRPWAVLKQQDFIFRNARVVDPCRGQILENQMLRVAGGKIVSPDDLTFDEHNATAMDCRGLYLCPGLVDCHVHLSLPPGPTTVSSLFAVDAKGATFRQPHVCREMLRKGFTTVRDTAGATYALKEAIEEGVIPGPRLFIAGKGLSQSGGHGDHRPRQQEHRCCGGTMSDEVTRLCDGVPECLRAAREELRKGADFLKIMVAGGVASPSGGIEDLQFTSEEIQAIAATARNSNTYVTAHAYTPPAIRLAIDNGVTCIEHGNLLDASTAELMAKRNVFLTPTLITYSEMASTRWRNFLGDGNSQKNLRVLSAGLGSLQIAREAGVTMCFGTDLLGPLVAAQTKEFALRAQILSPVEILQSATINAAKLLQQEHFLGRLEPGYAADILLLNCNPLQDITIFDRPEQHLLAVMKAGKVEFSSWSPLSAKL